MEVKIDLAANSREYFWFLLNEMIQSNYKGVIYCEKDIYNKSFKNDYMLVKNHGYQILAT